MGFDWEFILGEEYEPQDAYDDLLDTTENILEQHDTYMTEMTEFMLKKCSSPTFAKEVASGKLSSDDVWENDEILPFAEN